MRSFPTISTATIAVLLGLNLYFSFNIVWLDSQLAAISSTFEMTQAEAYVMPITQADYLPLLDTSVRNISLSAKAGIVVDTKTGRNLFAKNIHKKLPIASLTKVMTAVVVWESLDPNEIVTVGASAVKVDRTRQDLFENEKISVRNLMQLMLIESSNDAAYALLDHAASQGLDMVKAMNTKASELGMRDTYFTDPAGLDDHGFSTVADLVKVVTYALHYDTIWNFSRVQTVIVESADGKISHEAKTTNQLLGVLNDIIGGKTGYTDNALGCMILIVEPAQSQKSSSGADDKIIAIVLGSQDRFEDIKNLIQWTQHAYRWR